MLIDIGSIILFLFVFFGFIYKFENIYLSIQIKKYKKKYLKKYIKYKAIDYEYNKNTYYGLVTDVVIDYLDFRISTLKIIKLKVFIPEFSIFVYLDELKIEKSKPIILK